MYVLCSEKCASFSWSHIFTLHYERAWLILCIRQTLFWENDKYIQKYLALLSPEKKLKKKKERKIIALIYNYTTIVLTIVLIVLIKY